MSAAEKKQEFYVYPDPGDGLGPYSLIRLSKGKFARCSPEDLDALTCFSWHATRARRELFYARRYVGLGVHEVMHRQILAANDDVFVDHRNGDGLDNRRPNLRIATNSQNNANRHVVRGASRYRGVFSAGYGGKWRAAISSGKNRRNLYLGTFATEEAAARAYDVAARERHGEFAALNFPGETADAAAKAISEALK